MDRFERDAMDRHITGNYGEDSVPDDDADDGEAEQEPADDPRAAEPFAARVERMADGGRTLEFTVIAGETFTAACTRLREAGERFRAAFGPAAEQTRAWAAQVDDVAEDIAAADRPHAFRPRLLANDSPTLMCRVCGEFYDDERHRPADDPDDPRAAFLDDVRTYYGADGERVREPGAE